MKAFVKTWRHEIPAVVPLHGEVIELHPERYLLVVTRPVLEVNQQTRPELFTADGKLFQEAASEPTEVIGIETGYTILAGDEYTVMYCDSTCAHHGGELENAMFAEAAARTAVTPCLECHDTGCCIHCDPVHACTVHGGKNSSTDDLHRSESL